MIELNATGFTVNSSVIATATTASTSTIKGLSIYGLGFTSGSLLGIQSPSTTVSCNYLGVKTDGVTAPVKTPATVGITLGPVTGAVVTNNLLSGTTSYGIATQANGTNATISNNLFGTDGTGNGSAQNAGNVTGTYNLGLTTTTNFDVKNNVFANASSRMITASTVTTSQIHGNYFGIGLDGKTTSGFTPSAAGITANYFKTVTVGGSTVADRNYFGGMTSSGIIVNNISTLGDATIQGNWFGLAKDGVTTVPLTGAAITSNNNTNPVISDNMVVKSTNAIVSAGDTSAKIQNNTVGVTPSGVAQANSIVGISVQNDTNPLVTGNTSGNNTSGITISGTTSGAVVQGNYVGQTAAGAAIPNTSNGINVAGTATNTLLGGLTAGQGNVSCNNPSGIFVSGTPANTTIQGNTLCTSSSYGIYVLNSPNGITIQGNTIGLAADGVTKKANNYGIYMSSGTTGAVLIGGNTAATRNIISGNTTFGIFSNVALASPSSLTISGNYIGPNKNGDAITGAATGAGIGINSPNYVTIGGDSTAGYGNVISGNGTHGIVFQASASSGVNVGVYGNLIGTKPNGTTALGNGGYGLTSTAPLWGGAAQIGGTGTGQANVFVNNTNYGIQISGAGAAANPIAIKSNYIGILSNGTAAGNTQGGIFVTGTTNGLQIGGTAAGEGNIISGNAATASAPGIRIDNPAQNITIQGNTIGLGPDGVTARPNGYGVYIVAGVTNVTIGGSTAGSRNVISGNTSTGVQFSGSGGNNAIQGNYIGLDKNGNTIAGASQTGINIGSVGGVLIGGASAGQGNVISGNTWGVWFSGTVGSNVQVYGNIIGLKSDGETAAANNVGVGITASVNPAASLVIGGPSAGQRNIISGNTTDGIQISNSTMTANPVLIKGNTIGLTATGAARGNLGNGIYVSTLSTGAVIGGTTTGEGNTIAHNAGDGVAVRSTASLATIRGNAIYANTKLGIDLQGNVDAPDTNDTYTALDADTGGNGLQNFPQRTTMTACDSTTQQATYLWSKANTTYQVDFYSNPSGRDSTGYGEGEQYVSSATVTTDATGYASVTMPSGLTNPSMTATDPNGNTSEFSNEATFVLSACDVTNKTTADTTPSVSGHVTIASSNGSTPSSIPMTIDGQVNSASYVLGMGTLSLADNTLSPLAVNTYNVGFSVTDPYSKLSSSYTKSNSLTIIPTNPSVSIDQSSGQADPTSTNSASFSIVFSEGVTDLAAGDVTLSGTSGTVTTLTKIDSTHYTAIVTGMTSGDTVIATIASGRVTGLSSGGSNLSSTSTDNQVSFDNTSPTVTIDQSSGQADPTSTNSASFSIVFSEPVGDLTAGDITLAGTSGTVTTLTKIDSSHYTAIVTGMTSGNTVTATIAAAKVTDPAGNANTASTSTDNAVMYDSTAPTVAIARKSGQVAYTQTDSAWFTFTLSEAVATGTLTAGDIDPGTTTGTVTTLTRIDDTHYEFEVTGMTSGNTTTPSIAAGSFTDPAGNSNSASTSDADAWVMYDTTPPLGFATQVDVTSSGHDMEHPLITWSTTDGQSGIDHYTMSIDGGSFATVASPQSPTLTVSASHTIIVRAYDKAGNVTERTVIYPPIENITAPTTLDNAPITDTTIEVTGPSGMVITSVNISGAGSSGFTCDPLPKTVPVNCSGGTISSTGTLTVAATTNAGVTTSNSQDYVIDTSQPTVTINQGPTQSDPTNVNSATFRLVFSESIDEATLTAGDISLSGTSGTVTNLTKVDSQTWDATVTGMASGDVVTATLAAGTVQDPAGNTNFVSTSTDNSVTYDNTQPTVTINQASGQADPTNVNSVDFTVVFSEPVTSFAIANVQLSGTATGTVSSVTHVSGTTYTVTVTNFTSGDTVTATVPRDVVTDAAGNKNIASTSTDNAVTYDNTPPTATISTLVTTNTSPRLNGSVNDPAATVVVTVNGTDYTATNNGDGTWTLAEGTIAPALADNTYDIIVKATDTAGNEGTDATSNELTIDTVAPTGTISPVTATIDNSPSLNGTVDDPTASVTVTIDGHSYTAINNGDGTWTLPPGTISPGLSVGDHPVTVTFRDAAGNETTTAPATVTILRADADLPTVDTTSWIGGRPIITGTYDSADSQSLQVTINGVVYVLGIAHELTTSGDNWTLNLTGLTTPLAPGSYSVVAQVITRGGAVLGDMTTAELTVLVPTPISIITNPTAGVTLANTGIPVWSVFVVIAGLITSAVGLRVYYSRLHHRW